MNNVLEQFIGKECIIYTISNPSAVEGTITSAENGPKLRKTAGSQCG